MGNSSSYESPLLRPSNSPHSVATCPAKSRAKKMIGDPRSPSADFDRTPLRVQKINCSDPRSPSHGLPRSPIAAADENDQPQEMKSAAGKKKLFNITAGSEERALIVDDYSSSSK